MKVKPRKVNNKEKTKYLDTLYTTIACLNSREEIKLFLRDLLTESERIMLGRRILIAQKLLQDISYDQIIKEMRVGKDTIMRVHRWLEDDVAGYEKTIQKLETKLATRKMNTKYFENKPIDPFSFAGLKRKYPLHFALFNLFDLLKNSKTE